MSLEWNGEQIRILIDERKMGNEENKRSIVGEQYYEKFFTEFWKEPLRTNEETDPLGRKPSSSNLPRRSQPPSKIPRPLSSSTTASRTGTALKNPRAIPSPNRSRPTTPSLSRLPSSGSRPVTPSFSQSAETINIFINYKEPDDQE
ncbi:hypothetical protein C1645_839207 [Glomus cerebriforme]|uniref:Uncharacterized protein n=1 Tax=Glomus cerebriforme TaxID=658196 RepID=A0A397SCR2_9GLOM|nr:hypothetical protein C1645_839207 [Glomus cerebriforme]